MKRMKMVTERVKDGGYAWIALKDKIGRFHCWFDDDIISKDIVLAGNLYDIGTARDIKDKYNKGDFD